MTRLTTTLQLTLMITSVQAVETSVTDTKTVLLKTTLKRTIRLHDQMLPSGSNLFTVKGCLLRDKRPVYWPYAFSWKSLFFSVLRLQTTVMFCLKKRISTMTDTNCQPSTGSGSDTAAVCLMSKVGYEKCKNYQVLIASGLPGVLWFGSWWGSELFSSFYNTNLTAHFLRKLYLNLMISLLIRTIL